MGGQTRVPISTAVAPGQTADISVNMTVPNKTGKLTGVWAIYDNKGVNFGPALTVVVSVAAASPTPTKTAATTPGLNATVTVAPTNTPTP